MSGGLTRVPSLLCSTQHSPGAAAGGPGSAVQVQLSPREDGGVSLLITPLPSPAASPAASPRSSVASLRAEVCWPPHADEISVEPLQEGHILFKYMGTARMLTHLARNPPYMLHTHTIIIGF